MKKELIFAFFLFLSILFLLPFWYFSSKDKTVEKNFSTLSFQQMISSGLEGNDLVEDTIETGLDASLPFTSKYYYVGEDPHNFFLFQNKCFRIVSISQNDSLKLIYEGERDSSTCLMEDDYLSGTVLDFVWNGEEGDTSNTWYDSDGSHRDSLRKTLEYTVKNQVSLKQFDLDYTDPYVLDATWYVGSIETSKDLSLSELVKQERTNTKFIQDESIWKNKLGLMNVSDYLKVSCQEEGMLSAGIQCAMDNYLFKMGFPYLWTINASIDKEDYVGCIYFGQMNTCVTYASHDMRPIIYLKNAKSYIGDGSRQNPFQIVE